MGVPAWKTLPSWYLVAANDQAIPPDAERLFASRMGATTVEIPSSHVAMVSHPGEVAQLIKTAAEAGPATSWPPPRSRHDKCADPERHTAFAALVRATMYQQLPARRHAPSMGA